MSRPFAALAALLLMAALLQGCAGAEAGTQSPDFTVRIVGGADGSWTGRTVTLSQLRGRPVVIHFTASWCNACKRIFDAVTTGYADVFVMGVGVMDRKPNIVDFVRSQGLSAPVGYDEDGSIARDYGVNTLPLTVFIDRDGVLVERVLGVVEGERLRSIMERISA
ncbi:MAG TPA: TlpA family protein disulfide reductase [Deltaproteobacteria bacterium]|nr:TlpA family protein disulfide reductase [Deltaproteobacteria bacterium]